MLPRSTYLSVLRVFVAACCISPGWLAAQEQAQTSAAPAQATPTASPVVPTQAGGPLAPAAPPKASAASAASAQTPTAQHAAAKSSSAPQTAPPSKPSKKALHDQAEQQIQQQEHQRILGIIPNFNTSYVSNAAPLTPGQKFRLAFKSTIDPFTFLAAGLDAGYSQATDQFVGYGQGAEGYGKRLGASYADTFDGILLGNALFPVLLHEDPRYFRRGHGKFVKRLFYAISTTVIARNDNGTWGPNYANVLGNLAAGGISNFYYPPSDRGTELTFERAASVTIEGSLGAIFVEFWPDISHKLFKK